MRPLFFTGRARSELGPRSERKGVDDAEARLREEGRLLGNHYAYSYAIRDARVQRAYEMFREVFWARNFGPGGMHHESMKLAASLSLNLGGAESSASS